MSILVVDDHKIFLDSVTMLLRNQLPEANIYIATGGNQAIDIINKAKPRLVLLDINMPDMSGLEVAQYINRKYPLIKIIILTNVDGEAMVLSLMKLVNGFLFKDVDGAELKMCINTVLAGESYFCDSVKNLVFNNIGLMNDLPLISFSKKETNIVILLSKGKTTKEISDILNLKEKTVENYRMTLLAKTKTKNATELVAFAFHNGLIYSKVF